jgi:CheY-like chemotaxis protein/DNA-binding XRE family transcriptional regulator
MDVRADFGALIKEHRIRLGISQAALAERAHLHRTYVVDIEQGRRNLTLQNISRLADAFGLHISQLFPVRGSGDATQTTGNKPADILIVQRKRNDVELTLTAFRQARVANHVHVVRDGESALDFIFGRKRYLRRMTASPPVAVLMDLNLPGVGGLEILRHIRAAEHTRDIRVVVLSAFEKDPEAAQALRLGAAGHLVKPVSFLNFSQVTSKLDLSWMLVKSDARFAARAAAQPASIKFSARGFPRASQARPSAG